MNDYNYMVYEIIPTTDLLISIISIIEKLKFECYSYSPLTIKSRFCLILFIVTSFFIFDIYFHPNSWDLATMSTQQVNDMK